AAFVRSDAGMNVALAGLTLVGAQAGDYAAVFSPQPPTANITPALLTVTGIAVDKVYDGTTAVALTPAQAGLAGGLPGDLVTRVATSGTGKFASKDGGSNIAVTLSGLDLAGAQAANYTLGQPATTTANITPVLVTATGITADKAYDGTTQATL